MLQRSMPCCQSSLLPVWFWMQLGTLRETQHRFLGTLLELFCFTFSWKCDGFRSLRKWQVPSRGAQLAASSSSRCWTQAWWFTKMQKLLMIIMVINHLSWFILFPSWQYNTSVHICTFEATVFMIRYMDEVNPFLDDDICSISGMIWTNWPPDWENPFKWGEFWNLNQPENVTERLKKGFSMHKANPKLLFQGVSLVAFVWSHKDKAVVFSTIGGWWCCN